jgi:hypothetical protein
VPPLAGSGTGPGRPHQTQLGSSPVVMTAGPAGDYPLGRSGIRRTWIPRGCDPPVIARAGVGDCPQAPQAQHGVEFTELLRSSRAVHSSGILSTELPAVLLGKGIQDVNRIIGIAVIGRMRSHRVAPSSCLRGTVAPVPR